MIDPDTKKRISDEILEQAKNVSLISEINIPFSDLELIRSDDAFNYFMMKMSVADKIPDSDNPDLVIGSFLLVDFAIDNYDDAKYWMLLKEKYLVDPNDHSNIAENFKKTVIESYKLYFKEDVGRKNIGNIILHAFVPNKYLDAFYDMAFNYYESILGASIPDDTILDIAFSNLSKYVKDRNNGKRSENAFRLDNLIRSTLNAMEDPAVYSSLFKKILKIINSRYYELPYEDEPSLYRYQASFEEWYAKTPVKTSRDYSGNRTPRPYLRFNDSSNTFFLIIPPRVILQTDSSIIRVMVGNEEINDRLNYNKGSEIKTQEKTIRIDKGNPFEGIDLYLGCFRIPVAKPGSIMLFDENGKKIEKIGEGKITIVSQNKIEVKTYPDEKEIPVRGRKGFFTCSLSIDKEGWFTVDSEEFGVESGLDNRLLFNDSEKITDSVFVTSVENDVVRKHTLASKHPNLIFENATEIIDSAILEVFLPDGSILHKKLTEASVSLHKGRKLSRAFVNLNDLCSDEPGIYRVRIINYGSSVFNDDYLFVKDYSHRFVLSDGRRTVNYTTEKTATLHLECLKTYDCSFEISTLEKDENGYPYISDTIDIGGTPYLFKWMAPVLYYSVNNKWIYPGDVDKVIVTNLLDTVRVKQFGMTVVTAIYQAEGKGSNKIAHKEGFGEYDFSLFKIKQMLKNEPGDLITVYLASNGDSRKKLFSVIYSNGFEKVFEDDILTVNMKRSDFVAKCLLKKGEAVCNTIDLHTGQNRVDVSEYDSAEICEYVEKSQGLVLHRSEPVVFPIKMHLVDLKGEYYLYFPQINNNIAIDQSVMGGPDFEFAFDIWYNRISSSHPELKNQSVKNDAKSYLAKKFGKTSTDKMDGKQQGISVSEHRRRLRSNRRI